MPEQADLPLVVETGANLRTPNNHQRDSPNSPPWTPDSPSPLCKTPARSRSIRLQSRRRRHHVTVFSKSEDWEISAPPTTAPTSAESPAAEVFVALSTAEIAELRRVERQERDDF